jgi:hypothetical protein
MPNIRIALLAAALLAGGPLGHAAGAPEYLGEYCWSTESNGPDVIVGALKLGVQRFGEGHYPLYGTFDIDGALLVVVGNAEVTRTGIEATLQGTASAFFGRLASAYHLVFDGDLNGTYKAISFEAVGGEPVEDLTDEGIVTFVQCAP